MSQAPRKFSDKIAMIMSKQNEEAAEFMSVMKDVRPITASVTSGKSPNSTPSSTPYACSPTGMNNMVTTPTADSPMNVDHLQPHPLSVGWQRPGGSLPNVHQMLNQPPMPMQQPSPEMYTNWTYWPPQPNAPGTSGYGHVRTRSPGASQHYHPYKAMPKNERVPPLDSHMMQTGIHLQPPDPSWSNARARSDPAIHMNTMMNNAPAPFYNQPPPQWSPDMRMNGFMGPQQGGQPLPQNQVPTTRSPSMPNQHQQQPSSVIPNQPAPQSYYGPGSVGSMQMSMSPPAYNMQSPQGCQDQMPCGSLPNMHSPIMQASPQQKPMQQNPGQMPQQQPQKQLQQQFSYDQTLQNPSINYNTLCTSPGQLATPQGQGQESSQSAPTSPAQSYEHPMQPQWPHTRHYSASPDTIGIPNIVLTGADGTLDCFQDLRIDNEIAQLLNSNGEQQIDPMCETQLLN